MLQEVLLLLPKHLYASPNPCATYGGIGIARLFVRQLLKTNVIQYRISNKERNGPGGI
jgi:hypothetical protein